MSTTEDCELQDLVKRTLEKTGSLSKIRAELRADIFLALDENGCFQDTNSEDRELQNFSENDDGALVLSLVKDFLDTFGLSFTMSVLDPELASYNVRCSWKNRTELIKYLDLSSDLNSEKTKPLIYHIVQRFRNQQDYVPNPPSRISVTEKGTTRKFSDPLTECVDLPAKTCLKETEINLTSEEEIEQSKSSLSRTKHQADDVRWKDNKRSSTISVDRDLYVTDLCKPNSCLLGDLPPLSSPATAGKNNLSPPKSTKQLNKLKAMLIDPSQDTSNSSLTNLEYTDVVDNGEYSVPDDLNEKQMQKLLK